MLRSATWRNVWLLALTSLVADVSGEMLQAVLPFLLLAQGATGLGLGLVGGVAEGVGHFFKLVGGYAGERVRRKRLLVGSGYLMAALSRFGVGLASSWGASLAFRSLDRVGKGLRTAPRDALLADMVPLRHRGRAFGLHRAGDTLGAVIGILLALLLIWLWGESEGLEARIVLVAAFIGLLSVLPLFFVREPGEGPRPTRRPGPRTETAPQSPSPPLQPSSKEPHEAPSPHYWSFLVVSGLFYLGHVSYLFFILRAAGPEGGPLSPATAVLWYLAFNVVYMAASYPVGVWADRLGKMPFLVAGFGLAAVGGLAFALEPSPFTLGAGFLALGISYAATEGIGRAMASDLAGSAGRSHRLGWYHGAVGVATLVGAVAAGYLWDAYGQWAAFAWSALLSLVALGALVPWTMARSRQ